MPPVLTFNSALTFWGIQRVGRSSPQAPCLLDQSPASIRRRYRELALAWHLDKQGGDAAPAGAAGGSGQEDADLGWLRAARDKLLDELAAEQARDRQRLAEVQQRQQQRQLAAAANLLVQLADRRQECGKQWGVPAAGVQLRFSCQERRVGQSTCHYLGVTLSGGGSSSVTALVTKGGYLLDEPCGLGSVLLTSQSFAPELLTLQQACNERGWRLQQVAGGSLCVRVDSHHSAQLVDGTATATVLQVSRGKVDVCPKLAAAWASLESVPCPHPPTNSLLWAAVLCHCRRLWMLSLLCRHVRRAQQAQQALPLRPPPLRGVTAAWAAPRLSPHLHLAQRRASAGPCPPLPSA